jgi:hypothetical protein
MRVVLLAQLLTLTASLYSTEFFVTTPPSPSKPAQQQPLRDGLFRETGFLSLHQARDAVRALPMEQRCRGVTVTILGGDYSVREGHGMLQLDERDSGCEGAPVIYRGEQTAGVPPPTLHAGVKVPPSAFQTTTIDGIPMVRADVRPYGVSDFGEFTKAAETGQCVMEQRSSVYYQRQPQTLARHPNIDRATGNFQWMRVGAVSSFKSFASSSANDTIAAQRWVNDTTGDIWLHGFWTWDWADSFQRVSRMLSPPGGIGTNTYTTSWGAVETVPTVAACGSSSVLTPMQQQWNFTSVNVTNADNSTCSVDNILVNIYAPATLPAWAGGSGTPSHPGPVLCNCQKQLIMSGGVLSPGARPPKPECTNQSGMAFAQWQLVLNASTGQLKTGIPFEAPGTRSSPGYGYGAFTCASADHIGNVALGICVEPVPPHQRWSYDPSTMHLTVAGLAPPPPTPTAQTPTPTAGLCLTYAPHTVSYELHTVREKTPPYAVLSTSYNLTSNSRYYALNALGMLDQEGEFYFDKASGYLYFLPPPPPEGTIAEAEATADGGTVWLPSEDVYVSMNATIVNLTDVHDIVLQDLEIMYAKSIALIAFNVSRVSIINVSIGNTGGDGMSIEGTDTLIERCHIYGIGCSAMSMSGGDRNTLTPGNVTVRNNTIHDWALVSRSYEGAINFAGCGNSVVGNEIYNAPHTAITGTGNNFLFAHNHVHDVCRGTADSGAFYVGRTWASLGNTLEKNNFSHIGNVEVMAQHTQTAAIYLDDMDSGWLVQDNYLGYSNYCILMGGGRNNTVVRNYFDHCSLGIDIGSRNSASDTNPVNGTFTAGIGMSEGIAGGLVSVLHIDDPTSIWGKAYGPGSARPFNWTYLWDGPAFDHVSDNLFCGCHADTDEVQNMDDYAGSGPHPWWSSGARPVRPNPHGVNTTAWSSRATQAFLMQTVTNNTHLRTAGCKTDDEVTGPNGILMSWSSV